MNPSVMQRHIPTWKRSQTSNRAGNGWSSPVSPAAGRPNFRRRAYHRNCWMSCLLHSPQRISAAPAAAANNLRARRLILARRTIIVHRAGITSWQGVRLSAAGQTASRMIEIQREELERPRHLCGVVPEPEANLRACPAANSADLWGREIC